MIFVEVIEFIQRYYTISQYANKLRYYAVFIKKTKTKTKTKQNKTKNLAIAN